MVWHPADRGTGRSPAHDRNVFFASDWPHYDFDHPRVSPSFLWGTSSNRRLWDGTLYALPNICPHQFGPLCTGRISGAIQANEDHDWQSFWTREGHILTCPWHGIEFDITTGVALATDQYKVRQYVVSVVDGEVPITF
ncbi:MAG: Rieske (2Fe-2S) protein [Thermomicrobiales bacterium]